MRDFDKAEVANQLRHRRDSAEWWLTQNELHPLGIIPYGSVPRVLMVSRERVRHLCEEGRLRVIEGMPGGNVRDRFIPLRDVLSAPALVEAGRVGIYGPENRVSQKTSDESRTFPKTSKRRLTE